MELAERAYGLSLFDVLARACRPAVAGCCLAPARRHGPDGRGRSIACGRRSRALCWPWPCTSAADGTYCMPRVARARAGWRAEREAGDWSESPDRSWIFSFERICEALDLDAECIRCGVRTWKQRSGRRRGVVIDFRPRSRPDDNDETTLEIALRTALNPELVPAPMRGAGGARGTTAGS